MNVMPRITNEIRKIHHAKISCGYDDHSNRISVMKCYAAFGLAKGRSVECEESLTVPCVIIFVLFLAV